MGRLQGKVAFITGAGSGIARAAALLFAQEGAKVAIAELKSELGRASEQAVRTTGGDAVFIETDVTKEDSVRSLPSNRPLPTMANWMCSTTAPVGLCRKIGKSRMLTCGYGAIRSHSIC